ncbi:hypothetical protein NYF14_17425 [Sphingobium sp. 10 DY56-G10]|uniref:hypothetical protein n=1 Tax=Sphingomonadales TaxID=204457 RepID=UPI0000D7B8AE|nr:hypothetical protein [Sphingomonas sp. SKA58]EAT07382.1 hypothetical protein SKA58_14042 [Sphingomonas sp. SKA58]|tara:strand:- start:92 stop:526 length:435 start_codon:yes stop_codon:yes gene_type:complete
MTNVSHLIPQLAEWNNGQGITPADWIWIEGRADHALGFCSFFWPEFVSFEGYVLRGPLDVERLRGWENEGHTRQQIETAMNAFLLEGVFPNDPTESQLKETQADQLAKRMAAMLHAKLAHDFPERRFSAFTLEGEDFGVSFHQI